MARARKGKTLHVGELTLLRSWFDKWASGNFDLPKVLERLPITHLDSQDVASELLDWGYIRPAANSLFEHEDSEFFDPDKIKFFEKAQARQALKFYNELLTSPSTRTGALSCLWGEVPAANTRWLEQFVSGLSASACASLLLHSPSPTALKKAEHKLSSLVGQHIPQDSRLEITEMAVKAKKIPLLYALTGWPECQALSKTSEHDKLLELDLGL